MRAQRETFVDNVKAHLAARRAGYLRGWLACGALLASGLGLLLVDQRAARVTGAILGVLALLFVGVLLASRRWYFPTTLPNGLVPPRRSGLHSDRGSRLLLIASAVVFLIAGVVAVLAFGSPGLVALAAFGLGWLALLISAIIGTRARARRDEIFAAFLRANPAAGAQLASMKRAWPPTMRAPFQ